MNKIESAISGLIMQRSLILAKVDKRHPYKATLLDLDLAIQALKEKQERETGCEYCDPKNIDYYYAGNVPNYCKHCGRKLGEK